MKLQQLIKENLKNNYNKTIVKNNYKEYKKIDIIKIQNYLNKFENKRIGLYFLKSPEYILSFLGILLTSNCIVPLDQKQPLNRIKYFINDANIDIIIASKKDNIDFFTKKVIFIEDILSKKNTFFNLKEYSCVKKEIYIIYTSGSSGTPKGVIINNEDGIYNVINQQIKQLNLKNENVFLYLSISFDASISDILCAFLSDSVIFIDDSILLKPKSFINYFNSNKITYSDLPPSVLKLFNPNDFNNLNKIIIGGEKPSYFDVIKFVNAGYLILNVYGPTEFSICTSFILCNNNWQPKNIGKPLLGVEYHLIDNELYISGSGIALGYTNSALTKEKFIHLNNKKYFKTGDLVEKISNYYYFIGRNDRQIKINGHLICLEEIEENINKIKEIKNSAILFINNKVYCFYEGLINHDKIKKYIANYLPKYMIPNFFIKKNIPRNINGKNDLKRIENEFRNNT